jgi:hypothetical protein
MKALLSYIRAVQSALIKRRACRNGSLDGRRLCCAESKLQSAFQRVQSARMGEQASIVQRWRIPGNVIEIRLWLRARFVRKEPSVKGDFQALPRCKKGQQQKIVLSFALGAEKSE